MNLRTTLILIGLLAVVGGYLVWELTRTSGGDAGVGRAGSARGGGDEFVINLQKFQFRGISVRPAEGQRVDLRINTDDQWEIAEPPVFAGAVAIADYVTRLLSVRNLGPAPAALQQNFTPAVTVVINVLGGNVIELAVARPNAVGDTVARVSDGSRNRWLLVPRDTAEQLTRDVKGFRENRLVVVPSDDIGLLTFQFPDRWIRLIRDADGWGFDFASGTAPALTPTIARGTHRAEAFVVADLLRSLTSLRAADFPSGPGIDDGFDDPQLTLRYTRFDARSEVGGIPGEREVRFGRFEDSRRERVLALSDNPPVRALVAAASFVQLQPTPEQLRDRRPIPGLVAADITSIDITRGDTTTTLHRPAADAEPLPWHLGDRVVDADKVTQLLDEIASLRATRYLADPPAFDALTLTLHTADSTCTLRVGSTLLEVVDTTASPPVRWTFESPTDLHALLQSILDPPPAP